jgi:hypothetical protein
MASRMQAIQSEAVRLDKPKRGCNPSRVDDGMTFLKYWDWLLVVTGDALLGHRARLAGRE